MLIKRAKPKASERERNGERCRMASTRAADRYCAQIRDRIKIRTGKREPVEMANNKYGENTHKNKWNFNQSQTMAWHGMPREKQKHPKNMRTNYHLPRWKWIWIQFRK